MAARRGTRGNPALGDENKVSQGFTRGSAAATTTGTTKNAGLALRSKASSLAVEKESGENPTAGGVGNRRRTALSDSSNKVSSYSAGLAAGAGGGKAGSKLTIVTEEDSKPQFKQQQQVGPASKRTRSTASIGTVLSVKEDPDGDALMDDAAGDPRTSGSRPVKNLRSHSARSSSAVNVGAASTKAMTTANRPAGANAGVLAGRPTNIPRRPSNVSADSKVSTKSISAKTTVNRGTSIPASAPVAVKSEDQPKKSTKNAGLRVKREIEQVTQSEYGSREEDGYYDRVDRYDPSVNDAEYVEDLEGAGAGRRRRSKRLRASEPEPVTEDDADGQLKSKPEDDDDHDLISDEIAAADMPAKDEGWEDLDLGDEEDPLMVAEYVKEIHDYMKELEMTTMADPHYMKKQREVTWKMRSILIDWLIEVHGKFRLLPETIFLAGNILDRFLSIRTIALIKFQLVGIVSLFLAAKYEEVVCPSVSSFLYMTDGGYTEEELLSAERYVLNEVDYNLSYPNPINFLRRISKADGYDIQTRTVAKYFLEMSVVERRLIASPPSLIAAASMWLARKVLSRGEWHANLIHYSTYSQLEILPTAQLMLDYVLRRSQQPGEPLEHPHFHKKYSAKKFYKAAELVREWAEKRYLSKRAELRASGAASLFPALEGSGRLEEWEDEGEAALEPDFE